MRQSMAMGAGVLALCLAMSGCGWFGPKDTDRPPEGDAAPDDGIVAGEIDPSERLYSIYFDERFSLVMDHDGNVVEQEDRSSVLKDLLTGEPRLTVRTRQEDTGERDQDGWPVIRYVSALYDLDGSLISDWAEYAYDHCFGDFVVRRQEVGVYVHPLELGDGYETALWNYRTGEVVRDGVFIAYGMDGDSDEVLLCDTRYSPLGVVNGAAEAVSGFPAPATYYDAYPWNGHIIASPTSMNDPEGQESRREVLLTRDFEPVMTHSSINPLFYRLRGDYLLCFDGDSHSLETTTVCSAAGEVLFAVEGNRSINYFDGELVLVQTGRYRDEEPVRCDLLTATGAPVAEGFDLLEPIDRPDQPAMGFVGWKDGALVLLDLEGRVTASRELPYEVHSLEYMGDGYCSYTIALRGEETGYTQQEMEEYGWDTRYYQGVVNAELADVITPGYYDSIYYATDYSGAQPRHYGYFECGRPMGGASYQPLYDILDGEGNVVISNLSWCGSWGPNRIPVRKGFSMGLMDFEGNWVAEYSRFYELIDD